MTSRNRYRWLRPSSFDKLPNFWRVGLKDWRYRGTDWEDYLNARSGLVPTSRAGQSATDVADERGPGSQAPYGGESPDAS